MSSPIVSSSYRLRRLLADKNITITFGVSAYNEGNGIVSTLSSLWDGIQELGLNTSPIILSDSSSTPTTVQVAKEWARTTGAYLIVDHSDERRSLKAALNVILKSCHSDFLVVSVGDVVIPASSLAELVDSLLSSIEPDVVVGVTKPDPSIQGLRYKAGAWQLRVVARLAELVPCDEMRAEGAFWGARFKFFKGFRYGEGIGSLSDDVQLRQAVVAGNYKAANVPSAFVYKIPPGTIHDFCLQTRRSYFARGEQAYKRTKRDYLALSKEVVGDPVGFLFYTTYRLYAALFARRFESASNTEMWEISLSTKRGTTIEEDV